jgi:AraC-like DNA-binding protein
VLPPPLTVVTRHSPDRPAIPDQALIKALSFARESASHPIQVSNTARHSGLARRLWERRFMQILGRTPAQEMRRVHLERAKKLLRETDLAVRDVAEAAGFGSPKYMAFIFRKELRMTPFKHRRMSRPPKPPGLAGSRDFMEPTPAACAQRGRSKRRPEDGILSSRRNKGRRNNG